MKLNNNVSQMTYSWHILGLTNVCGIKKKLIFINTNDECSKTVQIIKRNKQVWQAVSPEVQLRKNYRCYEYEKRLVNCFLHKLIFVDSQKYYTLFFILLIKINGNDIVSCVYIAFLSFIYHSFASASDG